MSNKLAISDEKKYIFCKKVLEMESDARLLYIKMGEMLYNIRKERLYEPAWSSWDEYCMEFKDFSQSSISKVISVYETFVLKFDIPAEKLAAVGWTKLYALIPMITSKTGALEWIRKANSLTKADIEKEMVEAKTGVLMSKCKHPDAFLLRVCPTCGNKERVYE
jgi:hypothetical protein